MDQNSSIKSRDGHGKKGHTANGNKMKVCRSDLEMNDEAKLPGAVRTFISKQKYISLNKKVRAIAL